MIYNFDFPDVDIHETIWFGQKCLKMRLVIQILYFIICNILQNDWFLTICEIFLDVGRHQWQKKVFIDLEDVLHICLAGILLVVFLAVAFFFLLHHLIFIFVLYFFLCIVCFFVHSVSVLIPKIFHYLYFYLLSC